MLSGTFAPNSPPPSLQYALADKRPPGDRSDALSAADERQIRNQTSVVRRPHRAGANQRLGFLHVLIRATRPIARLFSLFDGKLTGIRVPGAVQSGVNPWQKLSLERQFP